MPFTVKKTFEAAAQAKAQIVVQLKDNQPTLRQKVESLCASGTPVETVTSIDQARSRHETRTVTVYKAGPDVATDPDWQPHVAAVVCVTRDVLTRNAKTGLWKSRSETAFYLSNALATAPRFASAIRGHWGIENKEHYTRDVTMREDDSRIRCNPGIFARLRSFAYNILRINQTDTFNQDRYRAALGGIDYLLSLTVS
jgi:predicted transposase YbfD/YdcC